MVVVVVDVTLENVQHKRLCHLFCLSDKWVYGVKIFMPWDNHKMEIEFYIVYPFSRDLSVIC